MAASAPSSASATRRARESAKADLDSFIAASAREPFTARIVVDTGDEWGPNAVKTIGGLKPACSVLRFGDLASRPFDWPDLVRQRPEELALRRESFALRPHQRRAFDDVLKGFAERGDRGKLIMACGTGKTFTALRVAEAVAGDRRSGALSRPIDLALPAVDARMDGATRAGAPLRRHLLRHPRGTHRRGCLVSGAGDPRHHRPGQRSAKALRLGPPSSSMTVVFCTYHSLGLVERAQDEGAPPFDLILCDEAHRTTGIERPGDKTSPFVLVHDAERIRAAQRLYMTATPRLYTEGAKTKAATHGVEVFSMDDEATYGPEFHRLPFSRAVEQGPAVGLQGRRPRPVRESCGPNVAGAPGRVRGSDQPERRGPDRRLLAGPAESGEPAAGRRARPAASPRDRVHRPDQIIAAPRGALGRPRRAGLGPFAGGGARRHVPVLYKARGRAASRPPTARHASSG